MVNNLCDNDMFLPASLVQKEIWALSQIDEKSNLAFNLVCWLDIPGSLSMSSIEDGINLLLARHDALQSSFSDDGESYTVDNNVRITPDLIDISHNRGQEQRKLFDQIILKAFSTSFLLHTPPLIRTVAVKISEKNYRIVIASHALVVDERSLLKLARELIEILYPEQQDKIHNPSSSASIKDYAFFRREWEKSNEAQKHEDYWLEKLSPLPSLIELPSYRLRPTRKAYSCQSASLLFSLRESALLDQLAYQLGVKSELIVLAGLTVYLSRVCRQKKIVIGLPFVDPMALRTNLVGQCGNLMPVPFTINFEESFSDYIYRCRKLIDECQRHRGITIGRLVQALKISRDPVRMPLLSAIFSDLVAEQEVFSTPNGTATIHFPQRIFEHFELVFDCRRDRESYKLTCRYHESVYDKESLAIHLESVAALVQSAVRNPEQTISSLPVVSAAERDLLLNEFNDTSTPLPNIQTILELFKESVEKYRDKPAIVFRETVLSYRDLDNLSTGLACQITKRIGDGRGKLIGIHLHRSHKMFVAILGVMKAGAGYVPLDPAFPHDRLQYMIDDAALACLITESALADTMFATDAPVIELGDNIAVDGDVPTRNTPSGDDIAYVIYTSGSTGKPKGVAVPHHGLLNLMLSMSKEPGLTDKDNLLAVTTLSFDMAVPELYLPLVTGATTYVAGKEDVTNGEALVRLIEQYDITLFQATPSTWRMLLAAGWQGSPRLKGLIGGEPLPRSLAEDLVPRIGELWNMYGPTETTVWSTGYKLDKENIQILVGRPIDNTQLYILDEYQQLVPRSVPGELYIGGAGVTRGYMNRDELNRRAFVANPITGSRSDIIYRTGDLVRYRKNGELEYISRLDHQIKLRGYRIELGEIETAITLLTGIKEVVVGIFAMTEEDQRLVAYIKKEEKEIELEGLKKGLREKLPSYMVPQHFVFLDVFPLTANGKVDRKNLPAPYREASSKADLVPPRNDFERSLVAVWQGVLKCSQVGITDNFFEIGGHSLLALTLIKKIKKATGIEIEYSALFQYPTIKELVDNLDSTTRKKASSIVPLQSKGTAPPLFCLCGIALYQDFADSLGGDRPVYAIYVDEEQALLDEASRGRVADVSVERLANAYRAAILRQQPEGPYQLAGISFGGLVAVETARRLQQEGHHVHIVILLDTILPGGESKTIGGLVKHHLRKIRENGISHLVTRSRKKLATLYRQAWMDKPGSEREYSTAYYRELAYIRAMEKYRGEIRAYRGDVILFKAARQWGDQGMAEYLPDYGWRQHVQGKLEVFEATGDHLGIISRPHVQGIADVLHPFLLPAIANTGD